MSPESSSSRELTRRLVAREAAASSAPDAAATAVHVAVDRACSELSRWFGGSGCRALVARALAQAKPAHPMLGQIRIGARSEPVLNGVSEIVRAHGAPAVAAALESVLLTLVDLLERLIGGDMAVRLLEQSIPDGADDDENPT